jgi:hypothetical protein
MGCINVSSHVSVITSSHVIILVSSHISILISRHVSSHVGRSSGDVAIQSMMSFFVTNSGSGLGYRAPKLFYDGPKTS